MSIGIGLYGTNGHQIWSQVRNTPGAQLVAVAQVPPDRLTPQERATGGVRQYASLDALLADDQVQVVSLCSPRRAEQAREAMQALEAGKHVYAEKPCAFTEAELDAIMATAARTGRIFHEMACTAFEQPYLAIGEVVRSGRLGSIVQVFAQKSYPWGTWRPEDEAVDGGLTRQVGVHAFRFVEHLTGMHIVHLQTLETGIGNPRQVNGMAMASACLFRLANGAVGTLISNYLNPTAFGSWGNETVRIWGTQGMVEAVDGGRRTRLVLGNRDMGPLDTSTPQVDFFTRFVDEVANGTPFPLPLAEELHPTRMAIRAKEQA